jgi:hypothetical protein
LRGAIDLRQRDEQHLIGAGLPAHASSAFAPSTPGLPDGNSQIDELPVAEEAEVGVGGHEGVPFEAGLGDQDFTLVEALAPRSAADRIARLDRLQRLLAVDDVDGRQRALEVRAEVLEAELHGARSARSRDLRGLLGGLQAAHDLLHRVRLHFLQQLRLFRFARQHFGLVERE